MTFCEKLLISSVSFTWGRIDFEQKSPISEEVEVKTVVFDWVSYHKFSEILRDTEGFVDGISKRVSWLGPLYKEFGAYFIMSVPKRMAPSIRNYQPICLMGSAFNFLARVLGNQLFSFYHIG